VVPILRPRGGAWQTRRGEKPPARFSAPSYGTRGVWTANGADRGSLSGLGGWRRAVVAGRDCRVSGGESTIRPSWLRARCASGSSSSP